MPARTTVVRPATGTPVPAFRQSVTAWYADWKARKSATGAAAPRTPSEAVEAGRGDLSDRRS